MSKFELDFDILEQEVMPKVINKIPVKGNEHRMVRVAFDLFRLDGNNREDLWVVQADDDGNEYLFRTYDLPEEEEISKNASWDAHLDKQGSNLTLAFEGVPVKRFILSEYGVKNKEDATIFKSAVLNKVAIDGDFANLFLKDFPMRGRGGRPMDGSGPGCRNLGEPMDLGLSSMFPEGNAVVIIDSDPKLFEAEGNIESEEKKSSKKEEIPSEDYDDPEDWWDNLSEEDQEILFEKFKDVPSITKEQAFKLTKLEIKLAKKQ